MTTVTNNSSYYVFKNNHKKTGYLLKVEDPATELLSETNCEICYCDVTKVKIKPCNHKLCAKCFTKMKACPFCRGKIEKFKMIDKTKIKKFKF
jgi:uncharacterized protein (UPF0276 family)